MKDLYTITKDCYSRMEAIKIFDQVKCYGDIELGIIDKDGKEVIAWICKAQHPMFLPIIKNDCQKPYFAETSFQIIETETPFIYNGKLFLYSEEYKLLEIKILFDACWAQTALELASDIYVNISELKLCKAINLLTGQYVICWLTYVQEEILTPHIFTAFLNTSDNFISENEPYIYQTLKTGETFEYQGSLWLVEEGEYGIQMTLVCPAAYHGKTS